MLMKKYILFFSVLIATACLCACSSDEGDDINVMYDFFETAFNSHNKEQKSFDFSNNLSNEEFPCIIINNKEEFEEAYMGDLRLPDIDFSVYTLVIGKIRVDAATFIDDISIKQIDNNTVALTINCFKDRKGCYIAIIKDVYYWKLFPKFYASEIKVEKK